MASVRTIAQSVRDFTGGLDHLEVDAPTVRALLAELEARYPGLGEFVQSSMVLAIDGEIHQNAWNESLSADTEVVLIPMIGAG